MFQRVLVANRGEIAVRVIRACTSSGSRRSRSTRARTRPRCTCGWPTVPFASALPPAGQSYLSIPAVIAAAETTGCQAVHPGYGFLAENADFARACADNDLVFVGPPPEVMERMGDKAQAKRELGAADVPLVPGTDGGATLEAVRAAADELGYPVLLKAAAGGGGKGMRLVHIPGRPGRRVRDRRGGGAGPRSGTGRSTSRKPWCPRAMSRSRCSATPAAAS